MKISTSFNRRIKPNRRGAALIEFAVCLPVFFMITMASIETCRMIYLRQSLKIAAYECARLAIVPGCTLDSLQDQCDMVLQSRNIRGYQFSCVPNDPATLKYGELFRASVKIAAKDSSIVGTWFYRDKTFIETVTIMAEY
jgi:hypothetical protein